MIENGMGIPRSEVYIANILKCRPPGNRVPQPDEREACTPVLLEQIDIIRPEFICCLGRISGRFLLGQDDEVKLKDMRQKFYDCRGARACVTYHPSALLQHPDWKAPAWEDLKFLMQAMGLAIRSNIK
jgi:uracil-DNA glycosylase